MQLDFTEKVIIITGSGRGIGLKIAERFAQSGATVVLSDYNETALQDAQEIFMRQDYQYQAIACDITDPDQVTGLIKQTYTQYQKIDVLINNAGITRDNLLLRMKDKDWDTVLETNLKGAFLTTRAIARYFMKQRYGKIINISSVVGITGNAGQANYAASKAGLIGFSRSVAKELASRNVTVNLIAPGFIETEMTANLPSKAKAGFLDNIPLNRAGQPEDVAHVALFLASSLADYITGQVLRVDGGMTM